MAVAFDAATGSSGSGSTSLTFAHTCGGSDRKLVVGVGVRDSGSVAVTGVTYNGVAMTAVGTRQTNGIVKLDVYQLNAPATGSNNVVVSMDGTPSSGVAGYAISLTGVDQGEAYDVQGGNAGSGTGAGSNGETTVTTTDANAWGVDFLWRRNDTEAIADAGQTDRGNVTLSTNTVLACSTESLASPGSLVMGWGWTNSHSWTHKLVAVGPSGGSPPPPAGWLGWYGGYGSAVNV